MLACLPASAVLRDVVLSDAVMTLSPVNTTAPVLPLTDVTVSPLPVAEMTFSDEIVIPSPAVNLGWYAASCVNRFELSTSLLSPETPSGR